MEKQNRRSISNVARNDVSNGEPEDNASRPSDKAGAAAEQVSSALNSAAVGDRVLDAFTNVDAVPDKPRGNENADDEAGPDPDVTCLAGEPGERRQPRPTDAVSTAVDMDLARLNATFAEGLNALLRKFEAKLAYDNAKQDQIDRLYDELQQHRSDLVGRTVRPLIHGIIRLHNDLGRLLSALKEKPEEELRPARFFALFHGFQEDLETLLGDNGVTVYREPNGPFDPRRQRVLRKVPTSDAALAGTVAESLLPGFEQGTQIFEKERIAAYEYRPAEEEAAPSSGAAEAADPTDSSDHRNEDKDDGRKQ